MELLIAAPTPLRCGRPGGAARGRCPRRAWTRRGLDRGAPLGSGRAPAEVPGALRSDTLNSVATRLETAPMAVAQAWLLQRSPNILLTSSIAHLRENLSAAALTLS